MTQMDPVERIVAELDIRNLASRYAYAVDSRNLEALGELFVPDVHCGRYGTGREALRDFYRPTLARFYRSIHLVGSHFIDVVDEDTATGTVYCRAEHEDGDQWVVEMLCYHDDYRRVDGIWCFTKRAAWAWYGSDVLARPSGPEFVQWDGHKSARLPERFDSWRPYWNQFSDDEIAAVTRHPVPRTG